VCGWGAGFFGEEAGGAEVKFWPFAKKPDAVSFVPAQSAVDILVERDCGREEFLLLYFKAIQEQMPHATLTMLGETVIGIKDERGKEATTYMDNIWLVYSRGEEDRRTLLGRYLRTAMSLVEEKPPLDRKSVVAIIKDSQYMEMFSPQNMAAHEHLCGDLWIVYAEDLPESTMSLHTDRLKSSGVLESEVKELARENLQRIMPATERYGEGPWYLLTAGGDYTASLFLFGGMWEDFASLVDGNVVAVVPSRDVVLFTGSGSLEGLRAIRERAREIVASGDHVISETLILRTAGQWEVFNAN